MTRIAYVINSLEGGGACAPVPAIAEALDLAGAEMNVFALTPRDGRGLPAMERAGLRVTARDGGERDHLAALAWLTRTLRAEQPDLIWTSLTRATLLGQIVGRHLGIDVISWQHAAFLKPANRLLLRMRQRRSLLWMADSRKVADLTLRRLGVAPERLIVWPLFVADPTAPQAIPWREGDPLRIGSMGRLHPVKGFDVLLDAFAWLEARGFRPLVPLEVAIAGEGQQLATLQARAAALRLAQVRFVGFREPRSFLAGLHLYVQPSRSEGMCLAAHEAMQAALPVVASTVGEIPRTLWSGVMGKTVPPDDPVALALGLATVLRDPRRLHSMGRAGRARVLERFGRAAFEAGALASLERVAELRASRG